MPSNTSASMFGGAGGRGSRISVASLEGLRSMLRKEPERDGALAQAVTPSSASVALSSAPYAAEAPSQADDKKTLRSLNERLSGYLGRVEMLKDENNDLKKKIDAILAKRKTPEGRNWKAIQEPLDALKKKVKDLTMENAKLMLLIDNAKLTNEDFLQKLNDETKARKELEKDLESLRNIQDATKISRDQTEKEIELVQKELAHVEEEHEKDVADLCEKIKHSEVRVEIESRKSDLDAVVNSIRIQYDRVAVKNLKDTENWYSTKFENIKKEEAQNTEAANSGKAELESLLKEKKKLEIEKSIESNKITALEGTVKSTKAEYNQRLGPISQMIHDLEGEVIDTRNQVEAQMDVNKNLVSVKMKLEQEIRNYNKLIYDATPETEGMTFALEDAVPKGKPEETQEVVKAAAVVKAESSPSKK